MDARDARAALAEWKRRTDRAASERDGLIRVAYEAGVNVRQIHQESGVSRTTIYKVLGMDAAAIDKFAKKYPGVEKIQSA